MPAQRPRLLAAILLALTLLGVPLATGTPADAGTRWAPAATAAIHPGVQMYTQGAQCTGNFVFADSRGNVYVGYAAHCAGKGSSSDINGCTTPSYRRGTPVEFVTGGNLLSAGTVVGRGRLAYSSWLSMQQLKTRSQARCTYNDFALVRVVRSDRGKVNPSVPSWGGPIGLRRAKLPVGATVYTLGHSSLRGGPGVAKTATVAGIEANGLAYDIKTGTPLIPGDSGSGFMDPHGRAVGVLSTISVGLGLGLTPVSNTIGSLYHEFRWARQHSGIPGLHLVRGTEPFQP